MLSMLAMVAWATPDTLLAEGMAAQRDGRADDALAAYTACLKADPKHVKCHWEIGWSHWTKSEWEEVVAHSTSVRELQPDHPSWLLLPTPFYEGFQLPSLHFHQLL